MGKFIDLTGQRFGSLVVIGRAGYSGDSILWLCSCDCGRNKDVLGITLRQGKSKSCGCLSAPASLRFKEKYGDNVKSGIAKDEYAIWLGIKKRCFNESSQHYELYGGRGVRLFDEWKDDFLSFYDYVGPRPSPKHSIDRIDVNGHYEPGNVRWASDEEQARGHALHSTNTTGVSNVSFRLRDGKTTCCAEVSVTEQGKKILRKNKEFSCKKYGLLPAMAMAVDWREAKIEELKTLGVYYSESHGTKRKDLNEQ